MMNSMTLFWLIALPIVAAPLIYFVGRVRLAQAGSPAEFQRAAIKNPPGYWTGVVVLLAVNEAALVKHQAVIRLQLDNPVEVFHGLERFILAGVGQAALFKRGRQAVVKVDRPAKILDGRGIVGLQKVGQTAPVEKFGLAVV